MLAWIKKALGTLAVYGFLAVIAVFALFVVYEWNMAGYDTYRRCRPEGGIGGVEWLFGVRPADNQWRC